MVFDTGSGHLILPSSYCHTETCKVHRRPWRSLVRPLLPGTAAVPPRAPGTSTGTAAWWGAEAGRGALQVRAGEARDQITVSFGTGEVTGVFVEDVMCFGQRGQGTDSSSTNVPVQGRRALGLQGYGARSGRRELRQHEVHRRHGRLLLGLEGHFRCRGHDGGPLQGPEKGLVGRFRRTSCSTASWGLASRASRRRVPSTSYRRFFWGSGWLGAGGLWHHRRAGALVALEWRLRRGSGFSKTFGIFLAVHNDETSQITMGGWAEEHLEEEVKALVGGESCLWRCTGAPCWTRSSAIGSCRSRR